MPNTSAVRANPAPEAGGVRRIGNSFLGRFVGNVWMEFWPDVRGRLTKRQ
jgi:hypothetical protein